MEFSVMQGSVFDCLPRVASESVDLCITSPPYWGLRDYSVEAQLGLEPTMEEYLENTLAWVKEVFRVLKPSGSFVLNLGDCYFGSGNHAKARLGRIPHTMQGEREQQRADNHKRLLGSSFYKAKQLLSVSSFAYCKIVSETDFVCRNEQIWCKPNVPSPIRSRLKHTHEKLFWFVKDADEYYFDAKPWMKKNKASTLSRWSYAESYLKQLEKQRSKARTVERDSPHADNIGLSKSSCYRSGKGEDYLKNEETIEGSYRIVPVGAKQYGFEQFEDSITVAESVKGVKTVLNEEGDSVGVSRKRMKKSNIANEHIAPFPEELIRPWVKSLCPKEICLKCGKPKKVVEQKVKNSVKSLAPNSSVGAFSVGVSYSSTFYNRVIESPVFQQFFVPSCFCNAEFTKGGVVLDPFLGSGTTMRVAMEEERNCVGIELNKKYLEYAKKRVNWGNSFHEWKVV